MVSPDKTFPVMEIFGPTIQGEGMLIGSQTMFIRFGGCDYRCGNCDTKFAVNPNEVRDKAKPMTVQDIIDELETLQGNVPWVTLSGGNPCLHALDYLIETLHAVGYCVAVETQGSIWQPWLTMCDAVTISPKAPGMQVSLPATERDREAQWMSMYRKLKDETGTSIKVVVFTEDDVTFAAATAMKGPGVPFYISIGNPYVDQPGMRDNCILLDAYSSTITAVGKFPELREATILPQMHLLLWGDKRGV